MLAGARAAAASAASCSSRSTSKRRSIPGVRELDPALWPGHARCSRCRRRKALVGAAQMNVIEFHTWNSLVRKIDKPDRVIFDLDPGEGERWERVQEAATLVRGTAAGTGAAELAEDQRRQGPARRRAAGAARRLGHRQGLRAGRRAAPGAASIPQRFVAKSGAGQPRRQDLRRLPAQQPRRHHGGGVLGARAAGAGRVDAAGLGRSGRAQAQRPVDRAHGARAPVVPARPTRGRTTGPRDRR